MEDIRLNQLLIKLFNEILETRKIPDNQRSIVVSIYKNQDDAQRIKLISLYKLWENITEQD